MQGTELVVTAPLCLASGDFHISTKISYSASAGTSVLVCGQSIYSYFLTFFLNPARRRRDGVKEDYYV
jgi:hypothetical protein